MVTGLFVAAGVVYAVACALFLVFLGKGSATPGRWATRTLAAAAVAHAAFLITDYVVANNIPFGDIHQTLSVASLLIVVTYLLALLKYRVTVLGAFLTPVTLLFFLGAGLGHSVGHVPPDVRSALLPVHIGVNVLGVVAFTLAFATALAYVIQERLLRRKRIGGLFKRLPPLHQLDSLGFRLVTIGFPLLTIGIVTGALWAVRIDPDAPSITASQGFAVVSWVVFAGVLFLRIAAGWRGRRAAIGTMFGFACAAAVLVGYMIQSSGGAH